MQRLAVLLLAALLAACSSIPAPNNEMRASAIATERNLAYRTDTDRIWIAIEEADAPPLIASFVEAGINVFHAQRRTQSLEEMFLEATGGESVD